MSGIAIPAPSAGWNARDSLSEMPPNEAVSLVNIIPAGDAVKTRPGYAAHSSALGGAVQTLVTYHGTSEALLCAANGKIINITAGGTGTNLGTGFSNNKWQTTEFKNFVVFCNGTDPVQSWNGTTFAPVGVYTTQGSDLVTNGAFAADTDWTKGTGWSIGGGTASCDGTQTFISTLSQSLSGLLTEGKTYQITYTISNYSAGNVTPYIGGGGGGTTRSANGTYTDTIKASLSITEDVGFSANADFIGDIDDVSVVRLNNADLIDCTTFKGRVLYVEKDSQSFWYPAAGSYSGSLTEFDLSQQTTTGGNLLYIVNWTRDGGSGVDDYAVFVFDTGEILVYAGSDPGSATDWAMLGRFRIGPPLGRRSAQQIGGDVIILTVDGYVPLSSALAEGRYSEQSDFSFKIDSAVKDAGKAYKSNFGWEAVFWPQASLFIINVPINSSESQQHVRNTTTGGWCKFTGIDASCFAVYGSDLYFGATDGKIWKVAGTSDAGAFINFECIQAFNYLGDPHIKKQITAAEPITDFIYPKYIDSKIFTDHSIEELPTITTPPEAVPSDWNVGQWNVAQWVTAGTGERKVARRNVTGMGYAISYVMRFKSRAQVVKWYATHLWAKPAGIV